MNYLISASVAALVLCLIWGLRQLLRPIPRDELPHRLDSGKDWTWHIPIFSSEAPFFLEPRIQPGAVGHYQNLDEGGIFSESVEILWHTFAWQSGDFHLEATPLGDDDNDMPSTPLSEDVAALALANRYTDGRKVVFPEKRVIGFLGMPTQIQYVAQLNGLPAGRTYTYSIFLNGVLVFASAFTTRKKEGEPFRAVIFGDMGNGSMEQRAIAHAMALPPIQALAADWFTAENEPHGLPYVKPQGADLLVSTGDLVYHHGRFAENLSKFFAIYQNRHPSKETGARFLDHSMLISCIGNHDVAKYDPETLISFDEYPDLMAWFALWSLPMNGPIVGNNITPVHGDEQAKKAALAASYGRYPGMANYSYDYGNTHFLVLDANPCMDWTNAQLRSWVEADLAAVKPGFWKIVILHQPPFTSNIKHQREQRMRFLADIFEAQGVHVVFCGHAHCYERSFPLKFVPHGGICPEAMEPRGYVPGEIIIDETYDGIAQTRANGVIYVVTGGGGAKLDSKTLAPEQVQAFSAKIVADRHTFTVADFGLEKLTIRQLDADAQVMDCFVISR
jgi:3',5'-cyclic AMP phosphodiesterase CpdA